MVRPLFISCPIGILSASPLYTPGIEIVPPGVRTTLLGQQDDEQAMPLADFLTETLGLLRETPGAKELVVDRARFFRDAQTNGSYDTVLAMLSKY